MKGIRSIEVYYHDLLVGEIFDGINETLFHYNADFLRTKIDLSPLSMVKRESPYLFDDPDFSLVAPLFSDSLPDGYGSVVMNRWFERENGPLYRPTAIDKLTYVGETGLGALIYRPGQSYPVEKLQQFDLREQERLASSNIAQTAEEWIHRLRRAARTAGGRFPKALLAIDWATGLFYEDHPSVGLEKERWVLKFGSLSEQRKSLNNYPNIEYAYHQMAKASGIRVPEARLIPSTHSSEVISHFASRRFDLKCGKRIHLATLSALTGITPGSENLTYRNLFEVAHQLSGSLQEVKEVFRRMVFNVLSCNADDHGKNHSFLFDGRKWELSPAYDLTFSDEGGLNHLPQHSMSIAGVIKNISAKNLLQEGTLAGLTNVQCKVLYEEVAEPLSRSRDYLHAAHLPEKTVEWVARKIDFAMKESHFSH